MMYCEYGACMLVFVSIKLYKPKMLCLCPPQDTPSPKTASQPSLLRVIWTWTSEEPLRWARMTLPVSTRCTNAVSDILTQNYIEIRKQIHSHNRLTSSQQHSRTRKNVGLENDTSEIVTNKSESVFVFFQTGRGSTSRYFKSGLVMISPKGHDCKNLTSKQTFLGQIICVHVPYWYRHLKSWHCFSLASVYVLNWQQILFLLWRIIMI